MKLAFFCGNLRGFHGRSLETTPLGGTETGVIRLTEKLQELGHEVHVYTSFENPPATQPNYHSLKDVETTGPFDVFIAIRDWIPIFYTVNAHRRFYWSGDSYDQFPNYGMGDHRVSSKIDAFLSVSRWQADQICKRSGFPSEKCFVLGNGIHAPYFEKTISRNPKRLIYSSTPYRGLEWAGDYFQALQRQHQDLEFHVYSSYSIYGQSDEAMEPLRKKLGAIPGVHLHGSVSQEKLAEAFLQSQILFYPCHFEETSCITAMEAMAAGCVPLSTRLGALPETVGDAGVLVDGLPGKESYTKDFLTQAHRLLSDETYFRSYSLRGIERRNDLSWTRVAERFDRFIKTQFSERLPL